MTDWRSVFSQVFSGKTIYGEFQVKPAQWSLEARRNVILQAPTGAGKTMTAEFPFLAARHLGLSFPIKMIYSVPMRVLANQFYDGFDDAAKRFVMKSRVQTGERPDDREFLGQAIFTTIDQTLSNFLGVPYALGRRTANKNVGAVVSGYLVFDEFHLFPPDGALKTTLQMLRLLKGVTPFLLMTATFSSAMLDQLKDLLDAQVVTVSPDELQSIPSQRGKARRFHAIDAELTAEIVRDSHLSQTGDFKRTLAVCNTVDRAQQLYLSLRDLFSEQEVMLLHSRFTHDDRAKKEQFVRDEFGPDKTKWQSRSLIVVATQVIEVGLDITCRALHTEVAPANAVLQRAGRCARYENEAGDVYIYQAPLDKENDRRNYAPYHQDGQEELCEKTWLAFAQPERQGQILNFHDEQAVINQVHHDSDLRVLEAVKSQEVQTLDRIERAVGLGDTSVRRDLIRQMDSWTIFVHDKPESLVNPLACQGFSLFHGSVRSKFKQLQAWAQERGTWALMRPEEEPANDKARDSRAPLRFRWVPIADDKELNSSVVFAVNPALVAYDDKTGFRFDPQGTIYRTLPPSAREQQEAAGFSYQVETYQQHITRMLAVYQRISASELAFAAMQLEQIMCWPPGSVDRAVRLAIALHDVGKLERRWQQWVHEYQRAIGEPILDETAMIVHTHSDPDNPMHKKASAAIKIERPHHAGEGALASAKIIQAAMQGDEGLRRAVLTAVAQHHSPHLDEAQAFSLHRAASQAIDAALQAIWTDGFHPTASELVEQRSASTNMEKHLLRIKDDDWGRWMAYFLIVRALRLADGLSQEEK